MDVAAVATLPQKSNSSVGLKIFLMFFSSISSKFPEATPETLLSRVYLSSSKSLVIVGSDLSLNAGR